LGVTIEPLGRHHDRAGFSCGQPDLDAWFRLRASQDEKRNVARVFVAVDAELGIVGFYSLSSLSLTLEALPEEIARKLPRYDAIPAALIGRLARDERVRGRGIGELLLADAIHRILGAGRSVAVFAIVVDAKDERAARFYESFGFRAFPLQPRRLFLPTATATAALELGL
jgi:ribosomal protein S18 acetylase RimI-like enzyme